MRTSILAWCSVMLAAVACGDDGGKTDIDAPPIDAPIEIDAPDAAVATCLDERMVFHAAAAMNTFAMDPMLAAAQSVTAPDLKPAGGSPALTGGATPPSDGFFDTSATYRGAIGGTDWTRSPQVWTAYPTNEVPADTATVVTLAGTNDILEITTNTTWTSDTTWKLPANLKVYVRNSAVLTIQPGTLIKGGPGSTIVITVDGRIDAQGTAQSPIVMTSDKATGTATPGSWGGLILLGKADINISPGNTTTVEGLDAGDVRNGYGRVGGGAAVPTHNCGTVKYVRIEYSGAEVSPGNEIQGLTMGGCGSQTVIDFVQIHRSSDDGVEIFGGTADVKHLLLTQEDDDGLDWDQGWTGRAQFIIVQHVLDKGFEADNNRNDAAAMPVAKPTIYNATVVGTGTEGIARGQTGPHLRRGTSAIIRNSIFLALPKWAIDVDGAASAANVDSGDMKIERDLFFHNGPSPGFEDWPDGFDLIMGTQNDCH